MTAIVAYPVDSLSARLEGRILRVLRMGRRTAILGDEAGHTYRVAVEALEVR
jgi:hypothetical protein